MTTDAMLKLAERCERATGPDRELDAEIGAIPVAEFLGVPVGKQPGCQAYTASLDAAMTLLDLHGLLLHLSDIGADGLPLAEVGTTDPARKYTGIARTLPLALCAAALHARSA